MEAKYEKPTIRTGAPIMRNLVESEVLVTATASLQKEIDDELSISSKNDQKDLKGLLEKHVEEFVTPKINVAIKNLTEKKEVEEELQENDEDDTENKEKE